MPQEDPLDAYLQTVLSAKHPTPVGDLLGRPGPVNQASSNMQKLGDAMRRSTYGMGPAPKGDAGAAFGKSGEVDPFFGRSRDEMKQAVRDNPQTGPYLQAGSGIAAATDPKATLDQRLGGASQALRGGAGAAAPFFLPGAIASAPIRTGLSMGAGLGTQSSMEKILPYLGLKPGATALGSDAAGALVGGLVSKIPSEAVVNAAKFIRHPLASIAEAFRSPATSAAASPPAAPKPSPAPASKPPTALNSNPISTLPAGSTLSPPLNPTGPGAGVPPPVGNFSGTTGTPQPVTLPPQGPPPTPGLTGQAGLHPTPTGPPSGPPNPLGTIAALLRGGPGGISPGTNPSGLASAIPGLQQAPAAGSSPTLPPGGMGNFGSFNGTGTGNPILDALQRSFGHRGTFTQPQSRLPVEPTPPLTQAKTSLAVGNAKPTLRLLPDNRPLNLPANNAPPAAIGSGVSGTIRGVLSRPAAPPPSAPSVAPSQAAGPAASTVVQGTGESAASLMNRIAVENAYRELTDKQIAALSAAGIHKMDLVNHPQAAEVLAFIKKSK